MRHKPYPQYEKNEPDSDDLLLELDLEPEETEPVLNDIGELQALNEVGDLQSMMDLEVPHHTRDVVSLYLQEIGQNRVLTPDEEKELVRRMRNGDFAARQKMIESNLRLVVTVAKHYAHRGVELLDLVAEGNLGLIHALDKYDPDRGFRFSTYAGWWIRHNIDRAIINGGRLVRLPVHVVKEINHCLRARAEMSRQTGEVPDINSLARFMDCSPDKVRNILEMNPRVTSLDAPLDTDPKVTVSEMLADQEGRSPEDFLSDLEMETSINEWLEVLSGRQRTVLEDRFGLTGNHPLTLDQIAQKLELSRERVRQIQQSALTALRNHLVGQGIGREDVA